MEVPAARYQRSARGYQKDPPPWDYEPGAEVVRLNSKGCVHYRQQRYFVCEALAGEPVALDRLEQRILVRYRQTYVREIDVESGRTRPLATRRASFA